MTKYSKKKSAQTCVPCTLHTHTHTAFQTMAANVSSSLCRASDNKRFTFVVVSPATLLTGTHTHPHLLASPATFSHMYAQAHALLHFCISSPATLLTDMHTRTHRFPDHGSRAQPFTPCQRQLLHIVTGHGFRLRHSDRVAVAAAIVTLRLLSRLSLQHVGARPCCCCGAVVRCCGGGVEATNLEDVGGGSGEDGCTWRGTHKGLIYGHVYVRTLGLSVWYMCMLMLRHNDRPVTLHTCLCTC